MLQGLGYGSAAGRRRRVSPQRVFVERSETTREGEIPQGPSAVGIDV